MALSLTKIERRQIKIVQDELRPWGLTHWVEMGGKHVCVKVIAPDGGQHRIVLSCTPKNGDNVLDGARQRTARLIRLMNVRAGY